MSRSYQTVLEFLILQTAHAVKAALDKTTTAYGNIPHKMRCAHHNAHLKMGDLDLRPNLSLDGTHFLTSLSAFTFAIFGTS